MQGDRVWFLADNSVKFIYSVFCKYFWFKIASSICISWMIMKALWKHFVDCVSFINNCWTFNKCIYLSTHLPIYLYFIFLNHLSPSLYQFIVNLSTFSYINDMLAMLWMQVLEFCMHFICIQVLYLIDVANSLQTTEGQVNKS